MSASASTTANKRSFRDAVDEELKMQVGENGTLEFSNAGLGSDVLAISQMVRNGDPTSLARKIVAGKNLNDIADLMILLFVTRNTRGGKGEKMLSYKIMLEVVNYYPKTAKELLKLYPHYGYWKDLFLLMELATSEACKNKDIIIDTAFEMIYDQYNKDLAALSDYKKQLVIARDNNDQDAIKKLQAQGPKISLLAKWLPREASALDKKLKFVKKFSKKVYDNDEMHNPSTKVFYRKQVAELSSYLHLPEVLLSVKRADEIDFHKIASKAAKKLSSAFLNENNNETAQQDPKRQKCRDNFLDHIVKKGLKGGQVMPHEIVEKILNHQISSSMELALDAQWKDLWKGVLDQVQAKAKEDGLAFNPTRMVPISDVSGSMSGTPMMVAIALGIGISEITHDAFKDLVLTFSETPTWHKLTPTDTIVGKVKSLRNANWGCSTNFELAYDRILEICVKHKLSREDMPTLIVFSDMQFNEAVRGSNKKTMFQSIKKKTQDVGHQLGWTNCDPTPIVFWNLRNTGGHPVDKDTEGAVLLSGFSPSLLKMVMNGEALQETEIEEVQADGTVVTKKVQVTPEEVLRKMLDDSLYDPVRKVLNDSKEKLLRKYTMPESLEGDVKNKTNDDLEKEDVDGNADKDGDGDFEMI